MLKVIKRYRGVSILILVCFFSAFIALNNGLLNLLKTNELIKLNNEYQYLNSMEVKITSIDGFELNDLNKISDVSKCNVFINNLPIYFKEINGLYMPNIILSQNEDLSIPTLYDNKKLKSNEIIAPNNLIDDKLEQKLTFNNKSLELNNIINSEKYTAFSSLFIINSEDYFAKNDDILKENKEIVLEIFSNKYNVEECLNLIKNNLNDISKKVLLSYRYNDNSRSIFNSMLSQEIILAIGLFIFALLNTIIISYYWISVRKREIAIRKTFGFTNYQIIKIIFSELFQLILLSTICALIVQCILNIDLLSILNLNNIIVLSLVLFISIIVSVMISLIIPLKYILSIEPAQGVKL